MAKGLYFLNSGTYTYSILGLLLIITNILRANSCLVFVTNLLCWISQR